MDYTLSNKELIREPTINHFKLKDGYWETLNPIEFYKKTFIHDGIIPSNIKYINDFQSWKPVLTILIVPPNTKVFLNILKKKITICRAERAIVKEQYLLDGFEECGLITESKSFYDESFIYKTNTLLDLTLEDKSGIYMYCNKIDAKCH